MGAVKYSILCIPNAQRTDRWSIRRPAACGARRRSSVDEEHVLKSDNYVNISRKIERHAKHCGSTLNFWTKRLSHFRPPNRKFVCLHSAHSPANNCRRNVTSNPSPPACEAPHASRRRHPRPKVLEILQVARPHKRIFHTHLHLLFAHRPS